jgi:hypothetical protein
MAVVAPMPCARVRTATMLKPGRSDEVAHGEGGLLPEFREVLEKRMSKVAMCKQADLVV